MSRHGRASQSSMEEQQKSSCWPRTHFKMLVHSFGGNDRVSMSLHMERVIFLLQSRGPTGLHLKELTCYSDKYRRPLLYLPGGWLNIYKSIPYFFCLPTKKEALLSCTTICLGQKPSQRLSQFSIVMKISPWVRPKNMLDNCASRMNWKIFAPTSIAASC